MDTLLYWPVLHRFLTSAGGERAGEAAKAQARLAAQQRVRVFLFVLCGGVPLLCRTGVEVSARTDPHSLASASGRSRFNSRSVRLRARLLHAHGRSTLTSSKTALA